MTSQSDWGFEVKETRPPRQIRDMASINIAVRVALVCFLKPRQNHQNKVVLKRDALSLDIMAIKAKKWH